MVFFADRTLLAKRFGAYFMTGGAAACVDAGVFLLLNDAHISIAPAALASFFFAAVVNFSLTAQFVFGHRLTARGLTRFMLAATAGLVINVGVTLAAAEIFALRPLIAKAAGMAAAFGSNFLMSVLFVFRGR